MTNSPSQPIRVMLVDDHTMVRRGLVTFLKAFDDLELAGEAKSGEAAIQLCAEVRPDVILMDMVMPEMSGVDAVREIRKLDPMARIVMCSAMGQQQLVSEAESAGASGFITKPFTASRVLEALNELANGRAA